MAGKIPLFASAPRCKITIDNQTVAYAIGLNVSASVQIQEVRILGEFAIQSLEPVSYAPVTGSLQIVRLLGQKSTDGTTEQIKAANLVSTTLHGQLADDATAPLAKVAVQNSVTGTANFSQTSLLDHLNPKTVLRSRSFDITISLKAPAGGPAIDAVAATATAAAVAAVPASSYTDEVVSFLEIKDCRLVGSSMNIAPGQLLTQSLEFQGLLMINKARGAGFEEAADDGTKDG